MTELSILIGHRGALSRAAFGVALAILVLAGPGPGTAMASGGIAEAFKGLCGTGLTKFDDAVGKGREAGWKPATGADSTIVAKIVERMRQAKVPDGGTATADAYEHGPETDRLYAVMTTMKVGKIQINGCHVYDFGAAEKMADAQFVDWLKIEPTRTRGTPQTATASDWDAPPMLPGYLLVKNAFIPPGSALEAQTGYTGVVLSATAAAN